MNYAVILFHWARIENWMANHFTSAIKLTDNAWPLAIPFDLFIHRWESNATQSMVCGECTSKTFIINEHSKRMSDVRRWLNANCNPCQRYWTLMVNTSISYTIESHSFISFYFSSISQFYWMNDKISNRIILHCAQNINNLITKRRQIRQRIPLNRINRWTF